MRRLVPYIAATLMVVVLTIISREVGPLFTPVNIALLYLLPVLVASVKWGVGPSFYAAALSIVAFDFFFVPPLFTYTVGDMRYLMTFAIYLGVATFTAGLASKLRQKVREARQREAITSALYALSRQVASARDLDSVLQEIVRHAASTFGLPAAIVLPTSDGTLAIRARSGFDDTGDERVVEPSVLRWVFKHGQIAGYGTRAHGDASLLYVPLKTDNLVHGVMCIGAGLTRLVRVSSNQIRVIDALGGLAAVSIARVRFEEEAKIAHLTAESERLRTALLDSISHELRTPLATITGAVTGMMESIDILSTADNLELLSTIHEGAMRMNRLVTNLLGMVRLESGMLKLNKQWCDIEDIVGVAINQIQVALQSRSVDLHMQGSLPSVHVDDVLIEQVLINVFSNAIKYSPDASIIRLDVLEYGGILTLQICDEGTGILPSEADLVFDKFYRSDATRHIPGTGLGLAISKGIILAHGGDIAARPAEPRGTIMTIRLPIGDELQAEF